MFLQTLFYHKVNFCHKNMKVLHLNSRKNRFDCQTDINLNYSWKLKFSVHLHLFLCKPSPFVLERLLEVNFWRKYFYVTEVNIGSVLQFRDFLQIHFALIIISFLCSILFWWNDKKALCDWKTGFVSNSSES